MFSILLGWDGLGISSYLLVIYYNRDKSYNAGIVTAITNRLGDMLVIIALRVISTQGNWTTLINETSFMEIPSVQWILITGCFTKSAQIPFRAWLPAAIAAPTPVSSLVHSSTLVTAGVYVLIRHIEHVKTFWCADFVVIIGLATIIIARMSAIAESDIKKMVALSTLRQLGIIVIRIGITWMLIAFMHLIIHAYFKAIIFIRTGNSIHVSNNYQACSKTGSILMSTPLNSSSLIAGRLRLIGAPFAAAFFSKEPILELIIINNYSSLFDYVIILIGVSITAIYATRFLISVITYYRKIERRLFITENDYLANIRVLILFIPSFSRGSLISNIYLLYRHKVYLYPDMWKISAILAIITGLVLALLFSKSTFYGATHHYILNIWLIPSFSRAIFNSTAFNIGLMYQINNFSWKLHLINIPVSTVKNRTLNVLRIERELIYRLILIVTFSIFIIIFII